MTLMGVGELGNFAAYGFAPASLIAPLGCVSVIGEYDLFSLMNKLRVLAKANASCSSCDAVKANASFHGQKIKHL